MSALCSPCICAHPQSLFSSVLSPHLSAREEAHSHEWCTDHLPGDRIIHSLCSFVNTMVTSHSDKEQQLLLQKLSGLDFLADALKVVEPFIDKHSSPSTAKQRRLLNKWVGKPLQALNALKISKVVNLQDLKTIVCLCDSTPDIVGVLLQHGTQPTIPPKLYVCHPYFCPTYLTPYSHRRH